MNRFALVGASYRTAGVERLGALTLPKEQLSDRLPEFVRETGAKEIAYLGTCNRVEFVLAGDDSLSVQNCRQKIGHLLHTSDNDVNRVFRAWNGEGAVEHLFLVAAGLDSAQPGEREIYAQVRNAWSSAKAAGTCGPQLDYLFGEALRSAQDVHRAAARPANMASLASIVVNHALEHVKDTAEKIAIVGVSPMTRRCALSLKESGLKIHVVNRTMETAQEFAAEIAGSAQSLEDFKKAPGGFNVIITAVGSNDPVLSKNELAVMAKGAPSGGTLIIDLGVPPNVDPSDAEVDGLQRMGMDSIIADATEGRASKLAELANARIVVDEHLERLRTEYAIREAAPMIQRLTTRYQEAAVESLRRLPRATRESLNGDDALKVWAEGFARRMAHAPLKGLRALAAEAGPNAVQAYMSGIEEALSADIDERITSETDTGGVKE
jgi:glutamyl-tRNA reductase